MLVILKSYATLLNEIANNENEILFAGNEGQKVYKIDTRGVQVSTARKSECTTPWVLVSAK